MPKARNLLWSDVFVVIEYVTYFVYVHSKCYSLKTCSNPIPILCFSVITQCFYTLLTYSNAK